MLDAPLVALAQQRSSTCWPGHFLPSVAEPTSYTLGLLMLGHRHQSCSYCNIGWEVDFPCSATVELGFEAFHVVAL